MRRKTIVEGAPRVYTVAEASRILQVQEPRVRAAIREQKLPAARIGNLYRIREEDLFRYFEECMVGGGGGAGAR